jgi:hypothetical protein
MRGMHDKRSRALSMHKCRLRYGGMHCRYDFALHYLYWCREVANAVAVIGPRDFAQLSVKAEVLKTGGDDSHIKTI